MNVLKGIILFLLFIQPGYSQNLLSEPNNPPVQYQNPQNCFIYGDSKFIELYKSFFGKKAELTNSGAIVLCKVKINKQGDITKIKYLSKSEATKLLKTTFTISNISYHDYKIVGDNRRNAYLILHPENKQKDLYAICLNNSSYLNTYRSEYLILLDFKQYLIDNFLHKEFALIKKQLFPERSEAFICDSINFKEPQKLIHINNKENSETYSFHRIDYSDYLFEKFMLKDKFDNNINKYEQRIIDREYYYIGEKDDFPIKQPLKLIRVKKSNNINLLELEFKSNKATFSCPIDRQSDFLDSYLYVKKIDSLKRLIPQSPLIYKSYSSTLNYNDKVVLKDIIYKNKDWYFTVTDGKKEYQVYQLDHSDPLHPYISKNKLDIKDFKSEEEELENIKKNEKAKQDRLKNLTKKFGQYYAKQIIDGYFETGMTKEMVLEVMGEPLEINSTVGSWGTHEQWVYRSGTYLYFENGRLTSFQETSSWQ